MPHDFEPSDFSSAEEFEMTNREGLQGEQQASETYKVTAKGGRAFGPTGETFGIAKRDLKNLYDERVREYREAEGVAARRLADIRNELEGRLETEPGNEQKIKKQIAFIDRKLEGGTLTASLGGYQFGLEDYVGDPQIEGLINQERLLSQQVNGINTVQPLISRVLVPDLFTDVKNLEDLHLLTRAVATSKVDQLIGTDVIATEKFGVGQDGTPISISVGVDGVGISGSLPNGKTYLLEVDYSRHEIQKGLYDLEAMDYITGQVDRHLGNVFIDPVTGKVKGIDNDLSFPQMSRDDLVANTENGQAVAKMVRTKPMFMHRDTARKIEGLDPEELRRELESLKYPGEGNRGRMSPEEINGAVERLKEMQQHIRELRKTGRVVATFDKKTFDLAAEHQRETYARENADNEQPALRQLSTATFGSLIDSAAKTSYVGALVVAQRQNELASRLGTAERLTFDQIKEARGITGQAPRSPAHEEYSKLAGAKMNEHRQTVSREHEPELKALNKKINECEQRIEKLQKKNLWHLMKSLRYGGPDGARKHFGGQLTDALEKERVLEREIDRKAGQLLENDKASLWQTAREKTGQAQPQQELGEGLRQSQNVAVEQTVPLTQTVDPNPVPRVEGPGSGVTHETDNLVSDSLVEEVETVDNEEIQEEIHEEVHEDIREEIHEEIHEEIQEEVDEEIHLEEQETLPGNSTGQQTELTEPLSQGETTSGPKLQRTMSVRDMLREQSAVQRAKAQLEQRGLDVGKKPPNKTVSPGHHH